MSDSPSHLKHLDERLAAGLRRDRALRWFIVAIAVIAMMLSSIGLIIVSRQSGDTADRADVAAVNADVAKTRADVAQVRADVSARRADRSEATSTAARRSSKRVVRFLQGKQGLPGVRGASGALGAPGPAGKSGRAPTDAEIRAAVDAYCAPTGCRGAAGDSVSRADVLAAITSYCAQRTCEGPAGPTGTRGADGKDGADGAPPPGSFSATFPEFVVNCIGVGANTAGGRSYTCSSASTTPAAP